MAKSVSRNRSSDSSQPRSFAALRKALTTSFGVGLTTFVIFGIRANWQPQEKNAGKTRAPRRVRSVRVDPSRRSKSPRSQPARSRRYVPFRARSRQSTHERAITIVRKRCWKATKCVSDSRRNGPNQMQLEGAKRESCLDDVSSKHVEADTSDSI
jgi:hypothetical protein